MSSTIRLGPTPIKARLNSCVPKPDLIVLSHATNRGHLESARELFARIFGSPWYSPLVISRTHRTESIIYASHLEQPDSIRHCTVYFCVYAIIFMRLRHVLSCGEQPCEPSGSSVERIWFTLGLRQVRHMHVIPQNSYTV